MRNRIRQADWRQTVWRQTAGGMLASILLFGTMSSQAAPDPADQASPRIVARHVPATNPTEDRIHFQVAGTPREGLTLTSTLWDFGDGTPKVEANVAAAVHTYDALRGETKVSVRGRWQSDTEDVTMELTSAVNVKGPVLARLKAFRMAAPAVPDKPVGRELPLGQPIGFSANGSTSPYGTIVRYEFDLLGDDEFEVDAGGRNTVSAVYPTSDRPHARVCATDEHGNVGVAHIHLEFETPGAGSLPPAPAAPNLSADPAAGTARAEEQETPDPAAAGSAGIRALQATLAELGLPTAVDFRRGKQEWGDVLIWYATSLSQGGGMSISEYDSDARARQYGELDANDGSRSWFDFHGYPAGAAAPKKSPYHGFHFVRGRYLIYFEMRHDGPHTPRQVAEIFYRHGVASGFLK